MLHSSILHDPLPIFRFFLFSTLTGQIYHVKAISAVTANKQPLPLCSSLIGVQLLSSLSHGGFKKDITTI